MTDRPTVSRRDFLRDTAAAAAALSLAGGLLEQNVAYAQGAPADIGVGVVGVGQQGRLLLAELVKVPKVVVVAYADPHDKSVERAAKIDRNMPSYPDQAAMLKTEKGIDAVLVASPTDTHASLCQEAVAAGKHVFCEAPLAHTVEAARAIALAAKGSQKVFQVGHQRRASELYRHALKFLRDGLIGEVKHVRAQWNSNESWRRAAQDPAREKLLNWRLYKASSGGLVSEYGSHVMDLIHWYLTAPSEAEALPEAVTGFGGIDRWQDGREVSDNVQVVFQYPRGVKAVFTATLANSHGAECEEFLGTEGALWLSRQEKGLLFKEAESKTQGWESLAHKEPYGGEVGIVLDAHATRLVKPEEEDKVKTEDTKTAWRRELDAFFVCVREGKPPPCTALDGLKAAVAAAKANEAIQTGQKVTLSPDLFAV
jgi:predicted dehydrogenase